MSSTQPRIFPLSEEGLNASGLPPFVTEKVRRIARSYRIESVRVEEHSLQGERATLWSETIYALWFYQGGSATWANIDGSYTTFDRIPDAQRPQPPSPDEHWWLRLAGEDEPYILHVANVTLRWGEVKGIHTL